jgi:hypothetical protein
MVAAASAGMQCAPLASTPDCRPHIPETGSVEVAQRSVVCWRRQDGCTSRRRRGPRCSWTPTASGRRSTMLRAISLALTEPQRCGHEGSARRAIRPTLHASRLSRFKGQDYRSSACRPLFGPFETGRGSHGLGSVQLALQCAVALRRVSDRRADAGPGAGVAAAPTLCGDDQASLRYLVLTGVPQR